MYSRNARWSTSVVALGASQATSEALAVARFELRAQLQQQRQLLEQVEYCPDSYRPTARRGLGEEGTALERGAAVGGVAKVRAML